MAKNRIDPEKFGAALKAWCDVKKITLVDVADGIGVHRNAVYSYTKSRKDAPPVIPNLLRAAEIAEFLGLTIDKLARGPFGEGLRNE